jgi:hypothetical protein
MNSLGTLIMIWDSICISPFRFRSNENIGIIEIINFTVHLIFEIWKYYKIILCVGGKLQYFFFSLLMHIKLGILGLGKLLGFTVVCEILT